jgi:hypothetical protein
MARCMAPIGPTEDEMRLQMVFEAPTQRNSVAAIYPITGVAQNTGLISVALHAYENVSAAREGIGRYINFYKTRPLHSSHQARTPDVVYFASLHQPSADAA